MGKISVAALAVVAALLVAFAAFGPASTSSLGLGKGSVPLLDAARVSAATVQPDREPSAGYTIVDEDQTATPTPTATSAAAASPQSLIRTVRLDPYNDASVDSGGMWSPSQNLGGWSMLRVGPDSGGTFRSYIRFLTGGLPPGMQIDSAILILNPAGGAGQAVPLEADYVLNPWDESSITWNQQPLSTYRAGTATWQPGTTGPLSIDVTSAAQQWYACGSSSNNGLLLSADLAPSYVDFDSRKSSSPPVLQITYQTAVAPVNCAAPPSNNVNLTAPTGVSPSTSGAQIGAPFIGTPLNPNPHPVAPGAANNPNPGQTNPNNP